MYIVIVPFGAVVLGPSTPTSIIFKSEVKTNDWAYSAHHRADGDILVGTGKGVQLYRYREMSLKTISTSTMYVHAVVEYKNTFCVLYRKRSANVVDMYSPDMTFIRKVLEYPRGSDDSSVAAMAVSDRYIVVNKPQTNQLLVHDFFSGAVRSFPTTYNTLGLHFYEDDLLTVGRGYLTKHKISDGHLREVWSYDGFTKGYSLCTDGQGLIYIATWGRQHVYIASKQGL